MGLRNAISLGFIQAAVSMAASFASVKVTSVYLGPAGIGILSQYQYIMSIVLGFAAGSTNTATVRLTAQYADDPAQYRLFLGTVSRSLLVAGIIVSVCLLVGAPWISERLLENRSWAPAIMLFGITYIAGLLHSLLLATANGAKDFRSVTLINISTVLVALVMFVVLSPLYGLAGAMAAAGLTPLVSAGVAFFWGRRREWMPKQPLRGGFSGEELRRFLSFVPMTLAFAVVPSATQIWARDLVAAHSGWAAVGLVQGVTRLSDMYLNVITTVLSMYYLPRFAEIRIAPDLRKELIRGVAVIVPAVAVISAVLYFGRDLLIRIIFTAEFLPMRDLFAWQMLGNVLCVVSWLFGYVLVARASPLKLVVLELVDSGFFVGMAALLIPLNAGAGIYASLCGRDGACDRDPHHLGHVDAPKDAAGRRAQGRIKLKRNHVQPASPERKYAISNQRERIEDIQSLRQHYG